MTYRYKAFSLRNFREIPQLQRLSEEEKLDIEIVGRILPFKTNNYVLDHLIDWDNVPHDPMFILNFPQREMLLPHYYEQMRYLIKSGRSEKEIRAGAARIQHRLNPHPAGQVKHNVPVLEDERLSGMQHKYPETVLFFPQKGQTCHAYCTFCFRWAQFVGIDGLRFSSDESDLVVSYLRRHPEVTDVLFTGGDPMIMSTKVLEDYVRPLLRAGVPTLKTLRIGTKALSYWPYRFTHDADSDQLLRFFEEIISSGLHVALMAHFNHPRELRTAAVREAIRKIRSTGVEIRTQSPLLQNINDHSGLWTELWQEQVRHGCIPYYMFVPRNTGAQHYFGVPLVRAWEIFSDAYRHISGLARTVRGPCMSAAPGKVQVLGISDINGEKAFVLTMLQGRKSGWVMRPFFARYDENAFWLTELSPLEGERFFFLEEREGFGCSPYAFSRLNLGRRN